MPALEGLNNFTRPDLHASELKNRGKLVLQRELVKIATQIISYGENYMSKP